MYKGLSWFLPVFTCLLTACHSTAKSPYTPEALVEFHGTSQNQAVEYSELLMIFFILTATGNH